MSDVGVRRITGISSLVIIVTVIVVVAMYFVYPGAPPAANVLTRDFLSLLTCAALLIFVSGFAHLLKRAGADVDWLTSLFYGSGLLYVGLTLVSISLEAGVVFGAPDGTRDPTIHGPLAEGNMLIHGPIKRLLTAMMLIAAGLAILKTRIVHPAIAYFGYAIAAFNLFFLPSLFYGTDPTRFYSTIGWGNSALCGSMVIYWIVAVGIAMLRRPRTG